MKNNKEKITHQKTTLIPQINPCLLSINSSIIYPVSIGEKKYPNKLNINWLILDEVAWQSFCTDDIIIPVPIGIIAAPKNKNVHKSIDKYTFKLVLRLYHI